MAGAFESFYTHLQHKGQRNPSIPSFGEAFEIWGPLSWLQPLLVIGNSLVTALAIRLKNSCPRQCAPFRRYWLKLKTCEVSLCDLTCCSLLDLRPYHTARISRNTPHVPAHKILLCDIHFFKQNMLS